MGFKHCVTLALVSAASLLPGAAAAGSFDVVGEIFPEGAFRSDPAKDCQNSGGTWIVPTTGEAYCELTKESEGTAWPTETDSGAATAVARAEAARRYLDKFVREPKIGAKGLLRETNALLALADKLLARWTKANALDATNSSADAVKRAANRKKAIAAWSQLRVDVASLEVEVKRRLTAKKPPAPPTGSK